MAELAGAVVAACKADPALVRYQPDVALEAAFAAQPALATPLAEARGFQHDGTIENLVANACDALAAS
jgi:hypothetical protein